MIYGRISRYGYVPTPRAEHRRLFPRFRAAFQLAAAAPRDLRPFTCKVLDQANSGSCVGHGTATGLFTAAAVAGKPLGFIPSPWGIYQNALCYDRGSPANGRLQDQGCMPSSAMLGLTHFGVRAMSPQSASTDVPQGATYLPEPDLASLELEGPHLYVGWYSIGSADEARTAIAAGCPVGIGTYVDTSFEDWTPSRPPLGLMREDDPAGGGHWTCLVESRSGGIFTLRNSWGTSYGDNGECLVTDDFVNQADELIAFGWKGQP